MAGRKGRMVIGQSGGPTAVINASLAGAVLEAQKHPQIEGIYGSLEGILGIIRENMIDLGRERPEIIAGLSRTPSAILGSCRYKLTPADFQRILNVFRAHNVRFFFYIGGNDSMDTAHRLGQLAAEEKYDLAVMGIPKTVDNDLPYTDHCPGYGSAARFTALAVRDAGRDTEAIGNVDSVKIIEMMGRNAGWLTAAAALAREAPDDAPHLIYVPERPLNLDRFLVDVQRVYDRLGHAVVALCETLRDDSGNVIEESGPTAAADAFGHPQRGGVAETLCSLIKMRLGLKARFDKAGTIQRSFMAAASPVDVREAALVGEMAVRHAVAGVTDHMITLERIVEEPYQCTTGLVELAKVANVEKRLPDDFLSPSGNDITPAFVGYARPLLGGPLPPYVRLAKHLVPRRTAD
jgi:ATP-dependent phosphofructokinase / diphosphate-dependent phosphofructokinase